MTKLRVDALTKFISVDAAKPLSEAKLKRLAKAEIFGKGAKADKAQTAVQKTVRVALKNVSFDIPKAGSIAILGEPGSGKKALLEILGGFEKPTLGTIWLDERKLTGLAGQKGMNLRRAAIRTATVQDRLFPHLTVRENLELAARLADKKSRYKEKTQQLIASMDLEGVAEDFPHKLTLHHTRRSLIAQSLTGQPKVLMIGGLLDGLPGRERDDMFLRLSTLREELDFSLVVTTEDAGIALGVGDEILMLDRGAAVQSGPSLDVILEPSDERVREAMAQAGLSDVMEAEALMQMPTVIQLGTTLTEASLEAIRASEPDFAAVIDKQHKFVGLVAKSDIERAVSKSGDLTNRIQRPLVLARNTKVRSLLKNLLEQDLPVAILADGHALQGIVSRKDIMRVP